MRSPLLLPMICLMAAPALADELDGKVYGYSPWRGLGDADENRTWAIQNGGAQITHYEVDASYDETAEPQLVLDFP